MSVVQGVTFAFGLAGLILGLISQNAPVLIAGSILASGAMVADAVSNKAKDQQ